VTGTLDLHPVPGRRPAAAALLACSLLLGPAAAPGADLEVQVAVNPAAEAKAISPYIYGTNQDFQNVATPGSRRYGGDRLTGYNWETNASNAGTDYLNESDNFLVSGLPASEQSTPGIALTTFHDQSLAAGTPYTLLTLQMAGYVAADESGIVTASQVAPSSRWDQVVNNKPGGVYLDPPDLTDGVVYMDECMSLLLTKYGPASGKTGVRGYDLDNEPSLWPSTHPLIHPGPTQCSEFVSKSVALATTIKRMDPSADVFGGVFYGAEAYINFQNAPDWAGIQNATGDRWFVDYYLDQMREASETSGYRLLDVLDIHRYSDDNTNGPSPGVSLTAQTDFTDTATDMDRVQDPRVLWDPSFVENSWVEWWDPQYLPWIPNFQASINAHYPGTRLSFSEYSFGGESDVSGGLAEADTLGIFGKYGVYLGCIWILHSSPYPTYIEAALNLYLDYDGKGGQFGATSVQAVDSDTVDTSAYASLDAGGSLHVVVINKSYTQSADFAFRIAGPTSYATALVYAFNSQTPDLFQQTTGQVTDNQLTYNIPPETAAHFVFRTAEAPPQFTAEPASVTVVPGATAVFTAAATGTAASGYQWSLNGTPLSDGTGVSGSAAPTLVVTAGPASAGSYACTATNAWGASTCSPAVLSVGPSADPGRLTNVSCRAMAATGSAELITGFVVGGGAGSEPVLVRASGPALSAFGVPGVLPDPALVLDASSGVVASNAGWGGSPAVAEAASQVGAFPWTSPSSHDCAVLASLGEGPYTAQITGESGDTGVALAEVYDATPAGTYTASSPRLINVSARVEVGTGGNILIAGFEIGGSTAKTVLVRASGPALIPFAVSGTLADPELSLYRSNPDGTSTLVATNIGWGGSAQLASVGDQVGAFSWGSLGTADSALLATLPPGPYTAEVSGASGDTGVALVEVYDVP
jgi:hypothetical protein